MEMLRRSSVFASEVFERSPSDKELVSQARALCRDYIQARLHRAGVGWSKPDLGGAAPGGTLGEVSTVLLWLGEITHAQQRVVLQKNPSSQGQTICNCSSVHYNR